MLIFAKICQSDNLFKNRKIYVRILIAFKKVFSGLPVIKP
ncbi:Uncharacterized protein dnm_039990 [Desulfonema magnum]|uniref:Uncharacterized protein n=1 Tax=Desulfonema magnum TaxID=45655 RepID=A0A975GNN3_9BACT|nr:Uncharacterized protein dnm_039990 [Desulfonema magnum]